MMLDSAPDNGQMLTVASCMAPIAGQTVEAIAAYLGRRIGIATRVVNDLSWEEREQRFDEGLIDVCWLCGLPYVWKADSKEREIELLAAPVTQGERYGGQPVYFSDVVVHRDSPFQRFDDLEGRSWAYNEPRSHSGYYVTRYRLAEMGRDQSFFGKIVAAGSHQRALEMILQGDVDASAIDSTVLELVLQRQPQIGEQIRVIDSWGPSPMPPWLAGSGLPQTLRQRVRRELLQMHQTDEGRTILGRGLMSRFARVNDGDYDAIRRMAKKAETVALIATQEQNQGARGVKEKAPGARA
jgi:phosphonate transport system substrate-binding protein